MTSRENYELNFETIYSKLQKRTIPNKSASLRFEIVHNKRDTLKLYSYGLVDILRISSYLTRIKDQIYFDKDYYKPIQIPPKPKGLSELEKLDSLTRVELEKELQRMINE
ncbi:hypothetical protein DF185_00535 [Marinifilum breve]|uniref:Uncharacterized protein n=1 Tax=Marinifilum breve TaxID=2184082 RepID=A0A2V4AEU2_9BACT|nr:hypothetical protein DF185_00535 [Marinifilum breve]